VPVFARTSEPRSEADPETFFNACVRSEEASIDGICRSTPIAIRQADLLQKAARLKLGHTCSTRFDLFESLELLVLGIRGKYCLWTAVQAASASDARLHTHDGE
jgi:hypothetical protein